MNLFKLNTAVIFIFTFLIISTVKSQEEDAEGGEEEEEEEPEKSCKKYLWNIIQSFLTGTSNCLGGKLTLRSPFEIGTRFYCLFKCILQDLGVLGANGKLDEVQALFFFQESIPPIIFDMVLEDAGPCLGMADQFIPSQYYCPSYGPFVQCVFGSLVRTLGPYALSCFATPGLGFFFSFINLIVPQATISSSSENAIEIRKRYREAKALYKKRHPNNSTLTISHLANNKTKH